MLAKNKNGWKLLEYLEVKESDISKYNNVTGAYAIIQVEDKYLVGYNSWRKQWEFPAGGIEAEETARDAAIRELFEETHQKSEDLLFRGLFLVEDSKGKKKYQAVYVGHQDSLLPFIYNKNDEMEKIMLWDMKEDIGYVDECDVKIVQIVCGKRCIYEL
jgi:8-oxo-dGTP diphosphatase